MNKSFDDCDFLKSLPSVLRNDKTFSILAEIFIDELKLIHKNLNCVLVYHNIDNLSEDVLDVLAGDLHVDWYDVEYSVEEKRSTIKNSVKVHKYLGTKYALETALSDIYPHSKVEEWFEYGGKPFYFRVIIDDPVGNIGKQNKVFDKIKFYKNLRSKLDEVIFRPDVSGKAFIFTGVAVASISSKITVEVKLNGVE